MNHLKIMKSHMAGHKIKCRKFLSVSGVITNSSTQVFELGITETLIELIKSDSIVSNNVIVIRDIKDVLNEVKKDYSDLFRIIYELDMLPESLIGYGGKGCLWEELNKHGVTDKQILLFIWPLIKDSLINKVWYTYSDDCGSDYTADFLMEHNYYGTRMS